MTAPTDFNIERSFLGLALQPEVEGAPLSILEQSLFSLIRRARRIAVILPTFSSEGAARLTWGFSQLDLNSASLDLFLGAGEDAENGAPGAAATCRCGWLRYLVETRSLSIKSFDPSSSAEDLVVFWDVDDIPISFCLRRQTTADETLLIYEGSLNWTFGNPSRKLRNFLQKVDSQPICEITRERVLKYLEPYKAIEPPFEELFDEDGEDEGLVPGYDLRDYQENAIERWVENGWKGIFAMCTGSGKTVASFGAAVTLCRSLSHEGEALPFVLVAVPKKILADQWVWEIEEVFGKAALKAYGSATQWQGSIRAYTDHESDTFPRFIILNRKMDTRIRR